MASKAKILVIDDDKKLTELLKNYLIQFNYSVVISNHPHKGLTKLKAENPELIILDVMLPDMGGFDVLKEIRKESAIPVIMLTARGEVTDRIVGLEMGADDYLPKPFEPRELVARIQTVLRRGKNAEQNEIAKFGELLINFSKQKVLRNGDTLELTTAEFELLKFFIRKAGRVLNRDEILDNMRGIEWDVFNRSIDVLISRLRQKLQDDPKHPRYIKTVWGSGYIFIGDEISD